MIKHIVMWRLKETDRKGANALMIKEKLEAMSGRIPGMLKIEVGIDFSCASESSDVVLYSEFESRQALDVYQSHPEHEAIKPFVTNLRIERRVVDYEAD